MGECASHRRYRVNRVFCSRSYQVHYLPRFLIFLGMIIQLVAQPYFPNGQMSFTHTHNAGRPHTRIITSAQAPYFYLSQDRSHSCRPNPTY